MDHPSFRNQDVIDKLTTSECMQLSNLREMRRSLAAVVDYLEKEESVIFMAVRTRVADQGGPVNEAD